MLLGRAANHVNNFFLNSGLLSYFSAGDIKEMSLGTQEAFTTAMEGAWNKDPHMFQQTGEAISSVLTTPLMAGMNMYYASHAMQESGVRRSILGNVLGPKAVPATEVISKGNSIYQHLDDGKLQEIGTMKQQGFLKRTFLRRSPVTMLPESALTTAEGDAAKNILKGSTSGSMRGGRFLAGMSIAKGIIPMVGIVGAQMAARGAMGFAGKIIDEAVLEDRMSKHVNYDSRFIRGAQQDEMSNLQLVGAGMGAQQNLFMQTGRIYHAR